MFFFLPVIGSYNMKPIFLDFSVYKNATGLNEIFTFNFHINTDHFLKAFWLFSDCSYQMRREKV